MNTVNSNILVTVEAAAALIAQGAPLSIAGPEALLDKLPAGEWIGGTTPYFITQEGGKKSDGHVFVTQLSENSFANIVFYETSHLKKIVSDAPENGFSFVIIPSGSPACRHFSEEGRFWDGLFLKPFVGWVAGIDLATLGTQSPKIYNGRTRQKFTDGVIAIHVTLPIGQIAVVDTINIFEREPSIVIRFSQNGTAATVCTVNGVQMRVADCLIKYGNADGKLPLIGDFAGASINVSIQTIDPYLGRVTFYAPVFQDVEYFLAKPVGDYAERFSQEIALMAGATPLFSCNCILNYLYGRLDKSRSPMSEGPVTFGEIAYVLHNQTMVTLTIL
jgi:hypothetical protein